MVLLELGTQSLQPKTSCVMNVPEQAAQCNAIGEDHMPRIYVTTHAGEEQEISAPSTGVLMEVLRDNDIDGIEGMCGGYCACATCHVHVDPANTVSLPPMSAEERTLASGLLSFSERSRLTCQIPLTDDLDGLRLSIPGES